MARAELTPQEIETRRIISQNFNKLLTERNVTQAQVNQHTKIPKSTITGYVKGTSTPSPGNIQKIADFFNVKKSDIDPRFGRMPINMTRITTYTKIPILGEIACGEPILADQNIEGYIDEISDLMPSGSLFYLKAKGNSMSPTIPDGSYVLIREQPEVEDGEVAAVLLNGDTEATLKRVSHQGKLVMLEPDNSEFKTIAITAENPARIIGKALSFNSTIAKKSPSL